MFFLVILVFLESVWKVGNKMVEVGEVFERVLVYNYVFNEKMV